MAYEIL